MLNRRQFSSLALGAAGIFCGASWAKAAEGEEVAVGGNGLHTQPWFLESFLELSDDLSEAAEEGKHYAILWEQRGCPYCREMHRVNFADTRIRDYITANYNVLQLDLYGARKVTDFDGEELEERDLARKWGIHFTPTIMFFSDDPKSVEGKDGKSAEVIRMPGYFRPFHFYSMFEYVRREKYEEVGFQRFLQERFAELEAKGIRPEVW